MLWLIATCPYGAEECVLSFEQRVEVREDASLRVQEDITVKSTGEQIKHGIYREFPTTYRWRGRRFRVKFKVLEVLRDGKPENWFVKELWNGIRVYIGDEDRLLEPGTHTYRIVYETDRQIGFFEDHDELYWNVNGTGWTLPMGEVVATVVLPGKIPAESLRYEAYTGFYGERGRDYRVEVRDSEVRFSTTRPLRSEENLTIVVGWPKGYVKGPGIVRRVLQAFGEDLYLLVLLLTLAIVSLYYLLLWAFLHRRSSVKVVVPEFHPPEGMSPAEVRYVYKGRCDPTCFTANLIDMAVKGAIKIKEENGVYLLEKLPTDEEKLTEDERRMYNALPDLWSHTQPHDLEPAVKGLKETLECRYRHLFGSNNEYLAFGVLLSVIGIAIATFWGPWIPIVSLIFGIVIYFTMVGYPALQRVLQIVLAASVARALSAGDWEPLLKIAALYAAWLVIKRLPKRFKVVLAFSLSLVLPPTVILFFLLGGESTLVLNVSTISTIVLLTVIAMYFREHVRPITDEGRKVMSRIAGFRMFLQTVERKRLEALFPNNKLLRIYERFLPYALALDVAETWANKFAEYLKTLGYEPKWYEGPYGRYYHFVEDLTHDLNESVASASAPPGSFSGFSGRGGGGYSGGGGGGGGGGGW